jgi:hypothetical protein
MKFKPNFYSDISYIMHRVRTLVSWRREFYLWKWMGDFIWGINASCPISFKLWSICLGMRAADFFLLQPLLTYCHCLKWVLIYFYCMVIWKRNQTYCILCFNTELCTTTANAAAPFFYKIWFSSRFGNSFVQFGSKILQLVPFIYSKISTTLTVYIVTC